jgi:hypothetical protein
VFGSKSENIEGDLVPMQWIWFVQKITETLNVMRLSMQIGVIITNPKDYLLIREFYATQKSKTLVTALYRQERCISTLIMKR